MLAFFLLGLILFRLREINDFYLFYDEDSTHHLLVGQRTGPAGYPKAVFDGRSQLLNGCFVLLKEFLQGLVDEPVCILLLQLVVAGLMEERMTWL